ncbi:S41 family peptidase [Cohnella lupini]|uniref:Carboxyl-terminal processing protease n=1 Tax=Cohnella lupini TaxID=1294267 RepID=A0A3D9IEW2_9BACL|nr:S41 family peptidase [Cohnella lupini]RED60322.1 carboxyl-terminal processing protease [Cohnella lupini]
MNPFKRFKFILSLLLALALLGAYAPNVLGASADQVEEVRELLEQYHLSKPDDDDLNEPEIDAMVDSLHDPYTQYFDNEEWDSFNSVLEQKFVGVGIVMADADGSVYVDEVITGSPAEAAGILSGDKVVGANGNSLKGKSVTDIQEALRGLEGTSVTLSVSRNGSDLEFEMKRRAVQIPVVTTRMLSEGIGYLALSGFTSDSANEVERQLAKLEENGLKSLVFDLRDNGGGYVDAAQAIANLFVEKGVLAHMRDRDGNDHPLELDGSTKPYSLYMLVNKNSASASELLSGALQDYGVAKLVGTRTYGKGVVQSLLAVKSGGMLKVTVQEYYTPTGRKVDKIGLVPDLYINGAGEQLIGAYRMAGGNAVTVTSDKGAVAINGVRVSLTDALWKDRTIWFVNLKLAASALGAKLTYDSKSRSYTLARGSEVLALPTNDYHVRIKDGVSSIDVRMLKKSFSGVAYTASSVGLKLVTAI